MKKSFSKAQISIFIIVAVVVVLLAIFLITLNSDSIKIFKDEKSSYKVEEFVESCLDSQTREAVRLIGVHGGWLYHKDMMFTDRGNPDVVNRKAKGISLFEQTDIPYWFYYDDRDEKFMINIPHYDTDDEYSLKSQVRRYVEENLEMNCIKGFSAFENVYEINYEPREIKGRISVEFDEEEVVTSLDLPLEITEIGTNNSEYIDYYEIDAENKLWVPYHIAKDIAYAEANSAFVEHRILNFLHPYQSKNTRDMLPPFYDFSMEYDFEPWRVSDVEKLVKQIVNANIGHIQFLNTDYDEIEVPDSVSDSEFVQGFKEMYLKDYLTENSPTLEEDPKLFREYKNFKIKGSYEEFYPTFFHLAPSLGNTILLPRPESIISFIPFFFTEYTAVYEMTMPVIFEIKSSSPNEKFVFNLAVESNIDHNKPLIKNRNISFMPSQETSAGKSLICDPVQYVSDYIKFNITDPVQFGQAKFDGPKLGVDDAVITFDCKGLAKCFMGETKINGDNVAKNVTQVALRLPMNCEPGTIEVYKFGHKRLLIENVKPGLEGNQTLGEFEMPSKKRVELKIKTVSPGNSRYSTGNGLTDYDKGFLIFTNLEDEDFVEVVEITKDNMDDLSVDLTIGNYSIEGFVIYNNTIEIPSQKLCYPEGYMDALTGGEECEEVPSITLDSWVRGGVEIKSFEVKKKELLLNNVLIVNFVDIGIPASYEDLEGLGSSMADLEGKSQKPEFIYEN